MFNWLFKQDVNLGWPALSNVWAAWFSASKYVSGWKILHSSTLIRHQRFFNMNRMQFPPQDDDVTSWHSRMCVVVEVWTVSILSFSLKSGVEVHLLDGFLDKRPVIKGRSGIVGKGSQAEEAATCLLDCSSSDSGLCETGLCSWSFLLFRACFHLHRGFL